MQAFPCKPHAEVLTNEQLESFKSCVNILFPTRTKDIKINCQQGFGDLQSDLHSECFGLLQDWFRKAKNEVLLLNEFPHFHNNNVSLLCCSELPSVPSFYSQCLIESITLGKIGIWETRKSQAKNITPHRSHMP